MKQINLIFEKSEFLVWNIIQKKNTKNSEIKVTDTGHQNIKIKKRKRGNNYEELT